MDPRFCCRVHAACRAAFFARGRFCGWNARSWRVRTQSGHGTGFSFLDLKEQPTYSKGIAMSQDLQNKRVAVLATHGVEDAEFAAPIAALEENGAEVWVVSLEKKPIKSWSENDWHSSYDVDLTVEEAARESFDAL